MAPGVVTATTGRATVRIDMREVLAQADKITQGAVSTFIRAARKQMDPVVDDARTRLWPVRTGTSQAGTYVEETISSEGVRVTAYNDVPYTYKTRFSVRTAADMDREAQAWAALLWPRLQHYTKRGTTPQAQRRIAHWALSEKPVYNKGRPSQGPRLAGRDMTGWWLRGSPSYDALRAYWKAVLHDRHGEGSPSPDLCGLNVWATRVRKPVEARESAVIEEARDALDKLAGG